MRRTRLEEIKEHLKLVAEKGYKDDSGNLLIKDENWQAAREILDVGRRDRGSK